MRLALALCLIVGWPNFAGAVTLELTGNTVQGGLVIGKTEPGAIVRLDDRPVRVSPDGDFLLGFGRDAKGTSTLVSVGRDGTRAMRTLNVKERAYDVQRIDGLPERQVTPTPEDLVRIRVEAEAIKEVRARTGERVYFGSGFDWPADGLISGVYGSQRILNGAPRQPHFGLDIAGPAGTPVRAAADGVVLFAHPGMYFNGQTLVIDHGLGLQSLYLHLDEISVAAGARVAKGEVVGRMGATGRVTGAHLHWGLQLDNTWLDPQLVLPIRGGVERH